MVVIGIATTQEAMRISAAGYTLGNRATAMSIFEEDMELADDELIVVIHVDCDPMLALWPTLCSCGGLRDVAPLPRPGFTLMRCERCGSTVEYRETK